MMYYEKIYILENFFDSKKQKEFRFSEFFFFQINKLYKREGKMTKILICRKYCI